MSLSHVYILQVPFSLIITFLRETEEEEEEEIVRIHPFQMQSS